MKNLNMHKRQSGAALVIGLVILLVMTLLGVSSMNSSRTELKIAANIQNKSVAYQVAENAIQRLILNPATPWGSTEKNTPVLSTYAPEDENYSATTIMTLTDCRKNPIGYSLEGDGINDGKGSANRAIIHNVKSIGDATAPGTGAVVASSAISVGIQSLLAGCPFD